MMRITHSTTPIVKKATKEEGMKIRGKNPTIPMTMGQESLKKILGERTRTNGKNQITAGKNQTKSGESLRTSGESQSVLIMTDLLTGQDGETPDTILWVSSNLTWDFFKPASRENKEAAQLEDSVCNTDAMDLLKMK